MVPRRGEAGRQGGSGRLPGGDVCVWLWRQETRVAWHRILLLAKNPDTGHGEKLSSRSK